MNERTPRSGQKSEETNMEENNNNIIELIDENGEAVQFEHLATLEHEGEYYIALMLLDDEHHVEDDEGEVVIMRIEKDEDDNECYVYVEDEDLQEAVFEKFLALMEESGEDEEE